MATGTKAARGGKKGSKRSGKTSAAKATTNGGSKREAAKAQQEKLIAKVVKARKSDTSWAEIASDLGVTPGKAQYLMMLHRVGEGDVPSIPSSPESKLVAGLKKARAKADEYSSWGWLSARAGVPEGRVKALAEEHGFYTKGKENIAAKRAGTNGSTKTTGKSGKGAKGKSSKGKSGSKAARGR